MLLEDTQSVVSLAAVVRAICKFRVVEGLGRWSSECLTGCHGSLRLKAPYLLELRLRELHRRRDSALGTCVRRNSLPRVVS